MSEEPEVKDKQLLEPQKILALCGVMAILSLIGVASATKDSSPSSSSACLLGIIFVSFGVASVTLTSKLQMFLYECGYRPKMPYVDAASAYVGSDASWGGSLGDSVSCGGDGGGYDG